MIDGGLTPGKCGMAIVTGIAGGNMLGGLAGCGAPVVAPCTGAGRTFEDTAYVAGVTVHTHMGAA